MMNYFLRICYIVTIVCLSVLFYIGNTHASETEREGFFLGLGIEPGVLNTQYLFNDLDNDRNYDNFDLACNFNFKVGYGLSDQFLIYITSRSSLSGLYYYNITRRKLQEVYSKHISLHSTIGVGSAYFLTRRMYIEGSLGLAAHASTLRNRFEDVDNILVGIGMSCGIGIHIHSNVSIGIILDIRRLPETHEIHSWNSYGQYIGIQTFHQTLEVMNLSLAFNFLIW